MDWVDPKYATTVQAKSGKATGKSRGTQRGKRKSAARSQSEKPLQDQVKVALAQPQDVWAAAYGHAVSQLIWPKRCSLESSFLWSVVILEQAEVLVRAGFPASKLAAIVSEGSFETEQDAADRRGEVVRLMEQPLEQAAFEWLETADAYPESALGVASLAWRIADHAARPGNEWLGQWFETLASRLPLFQPNDEVHIVSKLILHCELPLLVAVASSASKKTLIAEASRAMDNLAEYLEASADDPQLWLLYGGTYLRAALASVLRVRVLADSLGIRKFYPPQQKALRDMLVHAARWSRADGTHLLGAGSTANGSQAIWDALAKLCRQSKVLDAVMTLSGIGRGKRGQVRTQIAPAKLPPLTHYSEDAAVVCMQSDWRQKGGHVAVHFSEFDLCLEALGPKGVQTLAGEWLINVEVDGQAQMQMAEWQELCWFSDDDVDYLELEARFGQEARVQRQFVWFREERLLLLADSLLADRKAELQLSSEIPLAPGAEFVPAERSTEGMIQAPGGKLLVLPLGLPEWRRQQSITGSSDGLQADDTRLVSAVSASGNALYAPTLISLCNSHAKQRFTWRRLTVADELRIVGPDEAQAFRIQIGTDQWLIYRSLGTNVRRSALGMHTTDDFYVGRFDPEDGEFDTMLQVEASGD